MKNTCVSKFNSLCFLATVAMIHACGESGASSDPSAGISDPAASASANNESGINLSIMGTMPASIGSISYTTEDALMTGISTQSRDILFRAAKSDWLVTASPKNIDSALPENKVQIILQPVTNESHSVDAKPRAGSPRRWAASEVIDQTSDWKTSVTVKVPLLNPSGAEIYCAVLEYNKTIKPNLKDDVNINDFSMYVAQGACAASSPLKITALSAKSKLAPGDDKQSVVTVMGTQGLQVMNSSLWCWVSSPAPASCAATSSTSYVSYPTLSCDCEIRFDASGKVQSQKGIKGSILDLTKW